MIDVYVHIYKLNQTIFIVRTKIFKNNWYYYVYYVGGGGGNNILDHQD